MMLFILLCIIGSCIIKHITTKFTTPFPYSFLLLAYGIFIGILAKYVFLDEEKEIIERYIKQLEDKEIYSKPIVTQVAPFDKFWKAEDYHQDYEKRNPNNPYVKNVSIPRLKRFQEKYPELLKINKHMPYDEGYKISLKNDLKNIL